MLGKFVGCTVQHRHAQDQQFAQAAVEQGFAADRAHARVPAAGQRCAVQQLQVEVEQRATAARADRVQQLGVHTGRVLVCVVEPGHDMKRYTTKPA
jgi:hypothetical protein